MQSNEVSPGFLRHLPDLIAGIVVFAVMLALSGWHIDAAAAQGTAGARLDSNASAVLLAGAFAAMAVFNIAFVRHLRRTYAAPRRARRGGQAAQSGHL
ncbi:MAG: hypothetical protein AB7S70_13595 [Hyphomicrobium sp.]|uniref:hypothetical protein n=1 Tax=Hyphomicrobium sp. TaxID=82 RepID=UPI003D0F7D03